MSDSQESNKLTLSPSALGNYMNCGRRGQYYQNPDLPRPTGMGLSKGSAYHHALETFGNWRLEFGDEHILGLDRAETLDKLNTEAVSYLVEQTERDDFVWQPDDDIAEITTELWTMLSSWWAEPTHHWMSDGVEIKATEVRVEADFGSPTHSMIGYIDAVYEVEGYGTVLTDYKTAGRAWGGAKAAGDPRKLIQAPLYAEGWFQQTGIDVNWVTYDVMTVKGRFDRIWVRVDPEAREPFLQRWRETASSITAHWDAGLEMPTNPESMLCSAKWCSYWDHCPMGATFDQVLGK